MRFVYKNITNMKKTQNTIITIKKTTHTTVIQRYKYINIVITI